MGVGGSGAKRLAEGPGGKQGLESESAEPGLSGHLLLKTTKQKGEDETVETGKLRLKDKLRGSCGAAREPSRMAFPRYAVSS